MQQIHNENSIDLRSFHRIDINLYPLFVAVFEQKSISRAAQILSITQSAASHALQRLRQHLQDDLFVRTGSKMQPTPFAEQIYSEIKHALITIQNISIQNQQFEPTLVQNLKIAVHDEIEPMILPKLVAHFQRFNLDIQFVSIKLDRKNIVSDLATQQVDFVIDLEQPLGDKIQFELLDQDEFVVCTQQQQVTEKSYLASPHIGVSSRRTGVLVEDLYLSRNHLSRQIFLRCQHYSTALQILQQHPSAMLTIPRNVLNHLHIDKSLKIFEVPVKLQKICMNGSNQNEIYLETISNNISYRLCYLNDCCIRYEDFRRVKTDGVLISPTYHIIDTPLTGCEYTEVQKRLANSLSLPQPVSGQHNYHYGIFVREEEDVFQVFEQCTWQERISHCSAGLILCASSLRMPSRC